MRGWTPAAVAERLAEAADVLARLPDTRVPRGFYSLWPLASDSTAEPAARPAAPPPEAIDRMDEALRWLGWLDADERQLVWLRAAGLPWKRITYPLGIGRTTAWQRWTIALHTIATRLNAAGEQKRLNNKTLNKSPVPVLRTQ